MFWKGLAKLQGTKRKVCHAYSGRRVDTCLLK